MSLTVEAILKKRNNEKAAQCVRKNCDGLVSTEVGFHTTMYFCKQHGWKEMIAGKTKSTYTLAIADFPAIQGISLKFMPPWASTIPSNINKITIVESVDD